MFDRIFIEQEVKDLPATEKILRTFPDLPITEIDQVDKVFGQVKKPYLQKRETLNLFLGKKRGQLVKEAPEAYGAAGAPHYYFVHAYNCIYECQYCYLQGYFHSPDIVLFLNHAEIAEEIHRVADQHPDQTVWFHAGEFSDSLALSRLSGELDFYFDCFKKRPTAKLELRTKSANIRELLKLEPAPNIITSFSLSPDKASKHFDLKTPPLKARLAAMKALSDAGHPLAIHLDPIIYQPNFIEAYDQMLSQLTNQIDLNRIQYISLGVVRFTKDVYREVRNNYPQTSEFRGNFKTSFDGKVRYDRPTRMYILNQVKALCSKYGASEDQIYLCME